MRVVLLAFVVAMVASAGSLREAASEGSILNFAEVAARHFHALGVDRETGPPSDRPLVLYVDRIGDDSDADTSDAEAWLLQHLNVQIVDRPGGLPVYFTKRDLVGSKGNDALGATIPTGIAAETSAPTLLGCTLAHEVGHALGLRHAAEQSDIMAARCDYGKLEWATASEENRGRVDALRSIEALTLTGRVLWAQRA